MRTNWQPKGSIRQLQRAQRKFRLFFFLTIFFNHRKKNYQPKKIKNSFLSLVFFPSARDNITFDRYPITADRGVAIPSSIDEKKCSEKSGWDKEKVARRDEADQRRDARENERRRRQRERKKEEFASKQAKFQKSSKKPEAVGCCYAATIDHLGGRRRDSWSVRVFGHEILSRSAPRVPCRFASRFASFTRRLAATCTRYAIDNVRDRTEICRIVSFIRTG